MAIPYTCFTQYSDMLNSSMTCEEAERELGPELEGVGVSVAVGVFPRRDSHRARQCAIAMGYATKARSETRAINTTASTSYTVTILISRANTRPLIVD